MIRIKYIEYFFYEPKKLTEKQFFLIKQILSSNKNSKVFPEPLTWVQHYKTHFLIILIGVLLTCIGLSIFSNEIITTIFTIIGIITLYFTFTTVIVLVKETTSYREYYKAGNRYYSNLKKIILSSEDYQEFEYNCQKERITNYY